VKRIFKTYSGLASFLAARPGVAFHLLIVHEHECSPSRCGCRPAFELRDLTADNVLEGAALEAKWAKETSS
jgi:hypothetical protein